MALNILKQVNCERFETRFATDKGLTTEGFCKVSFEYCIKWKRTYTHKRKNRRNTDGRGNWQTRDNSVPVKETTRDLIDIIDEEAAMAVVDTEDCGEELLQVTDQEPTGCRKLYQTAKKKKRPLKNKLYNDPTSLSCDQWVMQKRRSTRRRHGMKLPVLDHHVLVRICESFDEKRQKGEWDQPTCSRPHTFLKRNLQKCMVGIKRGRRTAQKSRRRRLKDVAQDGSLTKKPRLDDTGDCGEELLQVADQESTEPSELQCPSEHSFDNDSTMSGPSFPHMMQGPLPGLCSGCRKLYQTAKKKKRPLKNKLLDPTNLSCDQWVMQKRSSTRRRHGMKLPVWDHHVLVRICESFYEKQQKGEWDQPTCSRPHTFLKRNLKKCMVGTKKGRRTAEKSRRRHLKDVAKDGSLTKQPRLDDRDCGEELLQVADQESTEPSELQEWLPAQDGSLTKQPRVDDSGISSLNTLDLSNISSYSNPVCSEEAGSNVKCSEVISTSVMDNGTGQLKMSPPKRSAAKKRACFNELFAQLFRKKGSIV